MTLEEGKRYLLASQQHEAHCMFFSIEPNVGRVAVMRVMDLDGDPSDSVFELYRTDGSYSLVSGPPSDRDVLRELPEKPKPAQPITLQPATGIYSKSGVALAVFAPKTFVRTHGWPEVIIRDAMSDPPEGYTKLQFRDLQDS